MSGYPKKVPTGWKRGERLTQVGDGKARVALMRSNTAADVNVVKYVGAVEFDTYEEALDWYNWWTRTDWQYLVLKYRRDDQRICNCQDAYYTRCGRGLDAEGAYRTDMWACAHGCSANMISARDQVAAGVLSES